MLSKHWDGEKEGEELKIIKKYINKSIFVIYIGEAIQIVYVQKIIFIFLSISLS